MHELFGIRNSTIDFHRLHVLMGVSIMRMNQDRLVIPIDPSRKIL